MATKHYEPASEESTNANAVDAALRLAEGKPAVEPEAAHEEHEQLRSAEAEGEQPLEPANEPAPRPTEEAPNPAEEEQQFSERVDERTQRRNAIYEKKSAERAAENARLLELAGEEPPVVPAEGEQPAESEPAPQPEAKRTLKYNRQAVEVTESEMERLAQIGMAAEGNLQEQKTLTQILRDTLARSANQGQDAPGRDAPPTRDANDPAKSAKKAPTSADRVQLTDEQLKELHEKLLYGDEGEGIEALRNMIDTVAGANAPSPDELLDQLDARRTERDSRSAAMAAAGTAFAGKHPEIASDETGGLTFATVRRLHRDVMVELQAAQLDPEQLAEAVQNPNAAFHFHKDLRTRGIPRADGNPLTDPGVMADQAAEFVKTDFRKRFGGGQQQQTTRVTPSPAPAQQPERRPAPTREARIEEKERIPMVRRAALSSAQRQPAAPGTRTPVSAVVDEYKERRAGPRSV